MPDGNFGVKASGGGGGGNTFAPSYQINLPQGTRGTDAAADMSPEMQEKLGAMLQEEINLHTQRKLEEWTRPGGQLDNAMKNNRR